MRRHTSQLICAGFCLVLAAACASEPSPGGDAPGGSNAAGSAPGGSGAGQLDGSCQAISPGQSPARRLTRFEYDNTIRDLLGDSSRPAQGFPPEEIGNGFGNDANALTVSRLLAEQYVTAAKGIAARLIADADRFAATLGCDPAGGEDSCAATFVDSFGARAYRRPLAQSERDGLLALYGNVRALGRDFKSAIGAVLQAMLQAPPFLYRLEFGDSATGTPQALKLDHYEMASRLSYLIWGSMPDATLFAAAAAKQLGTAEEVRAQAERMLGDPRAREMVRYFVDMLFGLAAIPRISKNPEQFPEFTSALPSLLTQETHQFLDYVIWEGGGDLKTLFTAPFSFMNQDLARYYGVADRPNAPQSAAFQRVDLDPTRAAGFLTHAGLLASLTPGTQTNPVLRGLFVRKNLLCSPPPPPPPALMVKEPSPDPTLTTRQRFQAHSADPSCYACHQLLDPVGFAFEHYDPVGRWRELDNGSPVDSHGELLQTDVTGPVADAIELAGKLAASQDVQKCIVGQWLTYGYGRGELPEDACTRSKLEIAFATSGGRIKDLLIALTQTDAFLYRSPIVP